MKTIIFILSMLVTSPVFAATVTITFTYPEYTMTAVDKDGNESAHSMPATPAVKFRLYSNGNLICESADASARTLTCDDPNVSNIVTIETVN